MSFLTTLISDLRDKRLWPVAAGLLAAIVAVPLLLATEATPPLASPVPAGSGSAPRASALPAVNVVSSSSRLQLAGRARDPFSLQAVRRSAVNPASSSSSVGGRGAAAGGGPGTATPTSSSGNSSGTTATTFTSSSSSSQPGAPARYFFYTTDLAFGQAARSLRTYRSVPRLTALPSAANPVMVFLGVKDGGRAALFMVWSLASLSGSGTCLPSKSKCFFLKLAPGARETINAPNAQGTQSTYTLRVTAIHLRSTSSLAQARAANARVSSLGSRLVAGAHKGR